MGGNAVAQVCFHRNMVTPHFPNQVARYGWSVAMDGNVTLIGAIGQDCIYVCFGSASIPAYRLDPEDVPYWESPWFGASTAIDGLTFLVGAPRDDDQGLLSGAAYLLEYDPVQQWWDQIKLFAMDAAAGDQFGSSVALDGNQALIGAPFDDDLGGDSGAVYVFERVAGVWTQTNKLVPSDGASGDLFGTALAVSGDTLAVGTPSDDDHGASSGSAYLFERSGGTWAQVAKLTPDVGAEAGEFGCSVALTGTVVVVGARGDDNRGVGAGSAYVFERVAGHWSQNSKLTAGDGIAGDRFGTSVAIARDRIAVGAPHDTLDLPAIRSGSGYLFDRTPAGWTQTEKLLPVVPRTNGQFGSSAAMADQLLVMGAPWDWADYESAGTATIFNFGSQDNLPQIISIPTEVRACEDGSVSISVVAGGSGWLRYRWWFGNTPLVDGFIPGIGLVNNATRSELYILGVDRAAQGTFSVQAYNHCGEVRSDDVYLTVIAGDLNGDHQVDLTDISILLSNFGRTEATFSGGDLTGDGAVDLSDRSILLRVFSGRC